jgi:FkbM family methyltransferase
MFPGLLSRVPRGAGDIRVAEMIYARVLRERTVVGQVGRARLELDLADWPQAQAYLLRRYDPATVRFVLDHLPPNGVFVDVGAHVGLISTPDVAVHAFEPHPVKGEALRRNLALNSVPATVNALALSDRKGDVAFDADSHSIYKAGADAIKVRTERLDDYFDDRGIETVDVLKLDVEGHEEAVLHGAERTLASGRIRAVTLEALDVHGDTAHAAALLEKYMRRVPTPDPRARMVRWRKIDPENASYVLKQALD